MRATIQHEEAVKAIGWHSASNPLRLLHVHAGENLLVIESSSDSMWRRSVLPARNVDLEGQADGDIIFSVARLSDQLRAVSKGDLTIEASDANVITTVGRSKASSPTVVVPDGFWRPGENDPVVEVAEVDLHDFQWAVKSAASVVAKKAEKGVAEALKMMRFSMKDGTLTVGGTNAYRIGNSTIECMAASDIEFLVPPDPFLKSLPLMDDPVVIIKSGANVGVRGGMHTMMVRSMSVDGAPDLTPVMRKASQAKESANVPTAEMIAALSGVAPGSLGQADIEFHSNYLLLANVSMGDSAEGRTEVEIEADVDPALDGEEIRVNAANLAIILRSLRTENALISPTRDKPAKVVVRESTDGTEDGTSYLGVVVQATRKK